MVLLSASNCLFGFWRRGREWFYLFIFLCTFGKTSCYIENIQFNFNSPDGQPLSKKALKKLQKDAEKAAKKAEYKAANKPAQQVKIFVDKIQHVYDRKIFN